MLGAALCFSGAEFCGGLVRLPPGGTKSVLDLRWSIPRCERTSWKAPCDPAAEPPMAPLAEPVDGRAIARRCLEQELAGILLSRSDRRRSLAGDVASRRRSD